MVFLIQRSQNKDSIAIHLKLNELIVAQELASNRLVAIEELSENDLLILENSIIIWQFWPAKNCQLRNHIQYRMQTPAIKGSIK